MPLVLGREPLELAKLRLALRGQMIVVDDNNSSTNRRAAAVDVLNDDASRAWVGCAT